MKRILLSLMLPLAANAAEPISPEDKKDFVEFYRGWSQLEKEPAEKQWVKVMFTDINADGKVDALATNAHSTYEENQSDWSAFKRSGDEWVSFKGVDDLSEKIIVGASVFGRPNEFFKVVRETGEVEFLVLQEVFDKEAPEGIAPLVKNWFMVDKEDILRIREINNLERYLVYDNENPKGAMSSLIRIAVEKFDKKEDD